MRALGAGRVPYWFGNMRNRGGEPLESSQLFLGQVREYRSKNLFRTSMLTLIISVDRTEYSEGYNTFLSMFEEHKSVRFTISRGRIEDTSILLHVSRIPNEFFLVLERHPRCDWPHIQIAS